MNETCYYDAQFEEIACWLCSIDDKMDKLIEVMTMDKQIKKLQKGTEKLLKDEGKLLKDDKKRDKACDMGTKMMKEKKK